jgi:hypothetical protein
LVDPFSGEQYLHFVPRKDVATITDALFDYYVRNRSEDENRPRTGIFPKKGRSKGDNLLLKVKSKEFKLDEKTLKHTI